MGKALKIQGADFSTNGIPKYTYLVGNSLPSTGQAYSNKGVIFVVSTINDGESAHIDSAAGVIVRMAETGSLSVVKYNASTNDYSVIQTASVTAGAETRILLSTPVSLGENEYIGIMTSNSDNVKLYYTATAGTWRYYQFNTATSTRSTLGVILPFDVIVSQNY